MNLQNTYRVWRTDGDAGARAQLRLVQTLATCTLTTAPVSDGVDLVVQGQLDVGNAFTPNASNGCELDVAGDDTLRLSCPLSSGAALFHLYPIPDGGAPFTPTRCSPGAVPCDGHRCSSVDAGHCVGATPCDDNRLGIPQCTLPGETP